MSISSPHGARGFSLLEVLVALMIFSMGLLGLAGILVLSVQTNHSATQRTQATFLAQSLAERMRANTNGIWLTRYNATLPPATTVGCDPTTVGGCDAPGIAAWDLSLWWDQVTQSLPAPSAVIACVPKVVQAPASYLGRPPYQGYCEIQLSWNEAVKFGSRDNTGTGNANGLQTFSWVFTP